MLELQHICCSLDLQLVICLERTQLSPEDIRGSSGFSAQEGL